MLLSQSIYLLPLISLLSPVWYLEAVVGGAYFLGITIAYIEAEYVQHAWVIARNVISFVFFVALTALKNNFKHKYFCEAN